MAIAAVTTDAVRFTPSRRRETAAGILILTASCLPLLGATLLTPNLGNIAGVFRGTAGVGLLVSLIITAPGVMIALLSPFAGRIADRIGRKRLLIVAAVVYSVFGMAPLLLGSLIGIVVSRVLLGACEAVVLTICTALLVDYFEGKRRLKYVGLQTVFTTISAVVFITVGGAVAQTDWRAPFWIYALGLLLAIPLALVVWEPLQKVRVPETLVRTPWHLMAVPMIFTLLSGLGNNVVLVNAAFLLPARGFSSSPAAIGLVVAALSVGGAASALSFRVFSRFGPRKILAVGYVVQAAGFAMIALGSGVSGVIVGGLLATLGFGIQIPTLLNWTMSGIHEIRVQGRAAGWWTSSFWAGQLLYSFVFAGVFALVGDLFRSVAVFGVIYLVTAVVAFLFVPRTASFIVPAADAPVLPVPA